MNSASDANIKDPSTAPTGSCTPTWNLARYEVPGMISRISGAARNCRKHLKLLRTGAEVNAGIVGGSS